MKNNAFIYLLIIFMISCLVSKMAEIIEKCPSQVLRAQVDIFKQFI